VVIPVNLYLCIVLDLYTKLVAGWPMHHRQDRQMVMRAVEMAIWQCQCVGRVILHADRGSQFAMVTIKLRWHAIG